jgi:hypothetical protein
MVSADCQEVEAVRRNSRVGASVLLRALWVLWSVPLIVSAALATRGIAQSVAFARHANISQSRVAQTPLNEFARICSAYFAASTLVVLLDAGYGYGTLNTDGYDDWNAAAFTYIVLPAQVLIAPDIPHAQVLIRRNHPQYLVIWLQSAKRETASLHLPEYAEAVQAQRGFSLIQTYRDTGGDIGLLFAIQ